MDQVILDSNPDQFDPDYKKQKTGPWLVCVTPDLLVGLRYIRSPGWSMLHQISWLVYVTPDPLVVLRYNRSPGWSTLHQLLRRR